MADIEHAILDALGQNPQEPHYGNPGGHGPEGEQLEGIEYCPLPGDEEDADDLFKQNELEADEDEGSGFFDHIPISLSDLPPGDDNNHWRDLFQTMNDNDGLSLHEHAKRVCTKFQSSIRGGLMSRYKNVPPLTVKQAKKLMVLRRPTNAMMLSQLKQRTFKLAMFIGYNRMVAKRGNTMEPCEKNVKLFFEATRTIQSLMETEMKIGKKTK